MPDELYRAPATDALLRDNGFHSFEDLWAFKGVSVEPINRRRGGWSGVVRLELRERDGGLVPVFLKRQENHTYRSPATKFLSRPTLRREFENLLALKNEGFRVTDPVYFETRRVGRDIRAVMITRELELFEPLSTIVYRGVAGEDVGALKKEMLPLVARLARRLHDCGWSHGAFYPKHLFVRLDSPATEAGVELAMVDLEKARKVRRIRLRHIAGDLGPLYRRCASILTRRDVLRFVRDYAADGGCRRERLALLKAIPVDKRQRDHLDLVEGRSS